VANEDADDEADHGEVLAAVEERPDHVRKGHADPEELVANPLERLQRADAGIRTNGSSSVPAPHVRVPDVFLTSPSDLKFDSVAVELRLVDRSSELM
jgi:hypothetical protein